MLIKLPFFHNKKERLLRLLQTDKIDTLNFINFSERKLYTGGRLLLVQWKTYYTKFEISDYVSVSKKHRTDIAKKVVKDILYYSFVGICVGYKRNGTGINSSFLLRNSFDGFPLEMVFPLFTPAILGIGVYTNRRKLFLFGRNKYFYLRKKENPQSTALFEYVLGKIRTMSYREEYKLLEQVEELVEQAYD